MENRPTKQYLDYLISTYTDTPDSRINGKRLNILQFNVNQSEFQYGSSPQVIQTNQCKNDITKSDSSV